MRSESEPSNNTVQSNRRLELLGYMGQASPSFSNRLAHAATEVLSPFILVAALLVWISWLTDPHWIRTGGLAVLFISVIPMAISLMMARTGTTTDRFIRHRSQRHLFYAITLVSVLLGMALILVFPSSSESRRMAILAVATLLIVMLINTRFKISIHALIAAVFAVVVPASMFHPAVLLGSLGVWIAASWSRVHLRRHSFTEVLWGSLLGAAVGALYLWLVGWLPWS